MLFASFFFLVRADILRFSEILGLVWRPILAAGAMAAVVVRLPLESASPLQGLALGTLAGVASFVAASVALWVLAGAPSGVERTMLSFVWRGLTSRRDSDVTGK